MRPYKVIRYFDDNGTTHYKVWFLYRAMFWDKWYPAQEWTARGCGIDKRFHTMDKVHEYLKSLNKGEEVVEEGLYEILGI